jgi:SPP1 family phage portal protein
MTKEQLIQLISGKPEEAYQKVMRLRPLSPERTEEIINQYDPYKHKVVTDKVYYKDKDIKNDRGDVVSQEPVNRIPIPLQQMIAGRAAAFLCANPIKLNATPANTEEEALLAAIQKTWEDNKLDYKHLEEAEKWMAGTICAELWYTDEANDEYWSDVDGIDAKRKLRMKLLSPFFGDVIIPIFDQGGDLIAGARGYSLQVGDDQTKNEEHLDIYTDDKTYKGVKGQTGWDFIAEDWTIGKIPMIIYQRENTEWHSVQPQVERLEIKMSRHANTNDYFDSPIVFVEGDLQSMGAKNDDGKILIGGIGSKAYYLSWDHAPESTRMEIENLLKFIHACTDTPDISFEALKGIGQTSGFALQFMFMGAHLKAAKNAGVFGEGIQRRINFLKVALSRLGTLKVEKGDKTLKAPLSPALKMKVTPVFEYFLPKNIDEIVTTLVTAVQGGIMSKLSGTKENPYIKDADAEMKQIKKEADEFNSDPNNLNKSFNND